MSKFAIPNVDIPKLTDSEQKFQYLLNIVQDLQQRVTSHDDLIAELATLRTENATLKAEITNLRAQLESPTSRTTAKNDSDSSSVFPSLVNAVNQTSAAPIPSYKNLLLVVLLCLLTPLLLVGLSTCT
ncbi:hypothetical protein G6F61_014433 [Rhizopus arrhizus]|nr:hypothetical protein G6F61_014433 [Rhizopus arrhizus]